MTITDFRPTNAFLMSIGHVSAGPKLAGCHRRLDVHTRYAPGAQLSTVDFRSTVVVLTPRFRVSAGPILVECHSGTDAHASIALDDQHSRPAMLLVESKVQMPVGSTLAGRQLSRDALLEPAPGIQLSNVDSRPTSEVAVPTVMLSAEPNPAVRHPVGDALVDAACGGSTSGRPRWIR